MYAHGAKGTGQAVPNACRACKWRAHVAAGGTQAGRPLCAVSHIQMCRVRWVNGCTGGPRRTQVSNVQAAQPDRQRECKYDMYMHILILHGNKIGLPSKP